MRKIMTPAEYVKDKGLHCPVCGSTNIEASAIEDESLAEMRGHSDFNCADCESYWGVWFDISTYTGLCNKDGDEIEIPDAEVDLVALNGAAPDLLASLEEMLGAFGYLTLTDPGRWPEIERAQIAFYKAKGE